ncbi:hypothetical protein FS837_009959 [Tulasnella sp. UAMH 9824]|nr:hypothetical protein FS837_009959 [Tulasnella sp. UAMH 9824]
MLRFNRSAIRVAIGLLVALFFISLLPGKSDEDSNSWRWSFTWPSSEIDPIRRSTSLTEDYQPPIVHQTPDSASPARPEDVLLPTKLVSHQQGWNVLDNVYMANSTLYFLTDEPKKWPKLNLFTSSAHPLKWTDADKKAREPSEWDIAFISPQEAKARWGTRVMAVKDWTFYVNEPNQFLGHYYHWVGETFFAMQRVYASLDPQIDVKGTTKLPHPSRFVFRHIDYPEWIKWAPINWRVIQTLFPSASVETASQWEQRGNLTRDNRSVWRFDQMLMADRGAAFREQLHPGRNHRTASSAWEGTLNSSSRFWWEPVRRGVLRAAGVDETVIDRPSIWANWQGAFTGDQKPSQRDMDVLQKAPTLAPVVISYISRQRVRRRMIEADEAIFVKSVKELTARRKWKFNHVFMEELTPEQQLAIAAETTIMIGVHGNGLTHLLWMPLTPLTTVMEIFYPTGFAKDYEWTARVLGFTHYAIHNDTAYTHPTEPKVHYPNGFQGTQIPIHGPSVAKIIEDRIDGRLLPQPGW